MSHRGDVVTVHKVLRMVSANEHVAGLPLRWRRRHPPLHAPRAHTRSARGQSASREDRSSSSARRKMRRTRRPWRQHEDSQPVSVLVHLGLCSKPLARLSLFASVALKADTKCSLAKKKMIQVLNKASPMKSSVTTVLQSDPPCWSKSVFTPIKSSQ